MKGDIHYWCNRMSGETHVGMFVGAVVLHVWKKMILDGRTTRLSFTQHMWPLQQRSAKMPKTQVHTYSLMYSVTSYTPSTQYSPRIFVKSSIDVILISLFESCARVIMSETMFRSSPHCSALFQSNTNSTYFNAI